MLPLYSPDGERALQALVDRRPLLAFDFDGTLAPIVDHPDDARIAPEVATLLTALVERVPVAIVTGRAIADVLPRLGFKPHYVVGNHGAEGLGASPGTAMQALADARAHLTAQRETLEAAGVLLEDKGSSLALHYRLAPDAAVALAAIERATAGLDRAVRHFGGKFVWNIVSAYAPDKGDAVRRLVGAAGAGAALFAGDDVNDEAVFEIAPPHWLTLRIGRDDRPSAARWYLDGHHDVARLLQSLLGLIARVPSAGR